MRNAAAEALEPIRRSRELRTIVERLEHPDALENQRWVLIDAALALGHPGIIYNRPEWFEGVRSRLPYPTRRYLGEELDTKRKGLHEELERRKRLGS